MTPRRALITGATGFVGSRLARRLAADGWQVSVIVRPESSLAALADVVPAPTVLRHDGSTSGMNDLMREARPDVVFHLASLFIAEHSAADIESLVRSNILFATQLAEAMAAAGCRYLVNTGTSWQHRHAGETGYAPVNLYAATKQACEDILAYYADAHGLRVITLALFDVYGPNDPRRKLMYLLRQALAGGEPLALSPGEQLIDLVYVDDVIDGYVRCADLLPQQEVPHNRYGLSSGEPQRLRDIVALIESITGKTLAINWGGRPYRSREVMLPWTQAVPPPGWLPRTPLATGIARVMTPTEPST